MKHTHARVQDLFADLVMQDNQKNDYAPISNQIVMSEDGNRIGLENIGSSIVSPLAHNQIADRLKIPRRYYDRVKEIPRLLASNVNTLLQVNPERRMVRTLGDTARAFLSDRYRPIDHLFVLKPFMEALEDYGKSGGAIEIKSNVLSDSRMYIQVIFPKISGEVVNGDVVSAGITLVNSEVGLGAFDVRSFLWRQWCSNGAVAKSYLRKYHTGRRIGNDDADYNIYSDETLQKEMDAFRSRLRDIFKHVITEDVFQDVLTQLRGAAQDKVTHPNTVIENVTKRFNLTEDDGDHILSNMAVEGNMSRYGVFNGITALAKLTDDAERAYEYERIGSEVITLSKSDWNVINEGKVA